MTLQLSSAAPKVTIHNGKAVTTSIAVVEYFYKLHKNVIQKIESLDCSPEFNRLNFQPVDYTDAKGEKRPAYEMTKGGFVFLAMGFTGKKAAAFKEAYIVEFNRMENELCSHQNAGPTALGAINLDIFLAIRDDKVAFIKHHQAGTLITIENALSILRQRG